MQFNKIPGHQDLKDHLTEMVSANRISHCLLFEGPEGNGALPLTIALAQFILCQNPSGKDSCGHCTNCKQVRSFNYPDLHFVYPVAKIGKSSDKPVSLDFLPQWVEILKERLYFDLFDWLSKVEIENKQAQISVYESAGLLKKMTLKSYSGNNKIVIIWLPERMNTAASNKLLKLLEEPPLKTLFFLVSNNADALLQTILSRTQRVFVPKFKSSDVEAYLTDHYERSPSEAQTIARMAQGNMAEVISLVNDAQTHSDYAMLFSRLMRSCYAADLKKMFEWADECGRFQREKIKNLLLFCLTTVQDVLGINLSRPSALSPTFKEIHFDLQNLAPFIHSANAALILQEMDEALYDISRNVNARVVLADFTVKLSRHLRVKI